MKEKETENTKVKAKEVCDSMKKALYMVMIELDRIEKSPKQSFVHEKFNRAYQEYKDGIRSFSRTIHEEEKRKFAINVAAACIMFVQEVKREYLAPEIMIMKEECLLILGTLVELYADSVVQAELKLALYDHNFNFSKGVIIQSRKILMPLQRDVLEKYGFLNFNHINSHPSDEN